MDALVMADNFLTQLLTNMQSQLERLDEKIDENHKDLSRRVSRLESHRLEKRDMPSSPLHNPKVVSILFYVALTALLLVAAFVGIDIKALL